MSIKKLFDSTDKSRNYLSTTTEKDSFENVESSEATLVEASPEEDELESTRASVAEWLTENVLSSK